MISSIENTAKRILDQTTEVVVRYRLLRDVLRVELHSPELQKAKDELKHSRCIQDLSNEQHTDGGWGAFHSRSSRLKQKVPSTEVGVERALYLGLNASHPILKKAASYILAIMNGDIAFPDYHEKNDRWQTGMRLFLASTLSLINPKHPALNDDRKLWLNITKKTFRTGTYSEKNEIEAHNKLTGATVRNSYLVFGNRYQLNILGSATGMLSKKLEMILLKYLWEKQDGIGYLGIKLNRQPQFNTGQLDRWLTSLEMLSRLFPAWVNFAKPAIDFLLKQRDPEGYWNFGPRTNSIVFLPLSDSWINRQNRKFDWTTRVLVLLRKYYDG